MIRQPRTYRECASSPARQASRAQPFRPSRRAIWCSRRGYRPSRWQRAVNGSSSAEALSGLTPKSLHCTRACEQRELRGWGFRPTCHSRSGEASSEMKTALISLEETEMTTVEMIAEQGRKAGASENDIQSLKMFIPARPRPLLVARYASPPSDAGTACGDQPPGLM